MVKVKKIGVVLEPTKNNFETRAVLNPAVYQEGSNIHVIYRAIDEEYLSCLGYARLEGPTKVIERWDRPFMYPKKKEESKGIEDPRIVKIDGCFYMTYVVHDGKNAITAYSYGDDLYNIKRGGVISPKVNYKDAIKMFSYSKLKDEYLFFESFYQQFNAQNILIWHKDLVPFPEKIDGRFWLMERILPDIQLLSCESLDELKDKYFWIFHIMNLSKQVILECEHGFESRHLGAGPPPVKTPAGWLIIYHSAQEFNKKRVYHAGAALLDLENPLKVVARLPYPLFSPTEEFELKGVVNDVVFPTGTAVFDNELFIYYGAADRRIAVASIKIDELLMELNKYKR